jgi:hypothetical protein
MGNLMALWRGDLRLGDAFWTWAVLGGLAVNITTSALFLWLITLDRPWVALVVGYGFSVPYNVAVATGVWRSAARHDGPALQADLARVVTLILMVVLSLT